MSKSSFTVIYRNKIFTRNFPLVVDDEGVILEADEGRHEETKAGQLANANNEGPHLQGE